MTDHSSGHTEEWESFTPTRGATPKRGKTLPGALIHSLLMTSALVFGPRHGPKHPPSTPTQAPALQTNPTTGHQRQPPTQTPRESKPNGRTSTETQATALHRDPSTNAPQTKAPTLHTAPSTTKSNQHNYPPPPLRKHQESQKNDGQTGPGAWTRRCLRATRGTSQARSNDISHG